jgi:hypothetical protein
MLLTPVCCDIGQTERSLRDHTSVHNDIRDTLQKPCGLKVGDCTVTFLSDYN